MSINFGRALTPHLPFDLDVSTLPADVHAIGLWHGTAHTLRGATPVGSSICPDPRLASGTDAAGTKFDLAGYPYYSINSDIDLSGTPATPHITGGSHQGRIRVAGFPTSGTEWGSTGWRERDTRIEMAWVRNAGLTGFAWEPLGPTGNNYNTYRDAFYAADAFGNGIKIGCQIDSASLNNLSTVAQVMADAVRSQLLNPATLKAQGGTPIFCFKPDDLGTTWFENFFDQLEASNAYVDGTVVGAAVTPVTDAYLAPIFNDGSSSGTSALLAEYAALMTRNSGVRGTSKSLCGWWGNTAPGLIDASAFDYSDFATLVRNYAGVGHNIIWGLRGQQVRRRDSEAWFNETAGFRLLHQCGEYFCANKQSGDVLYVNSWNDLKDGSDFCPCDRTQWALYDIMAYYATWFRTGVRPTIVRDCIYYAHRLHKHDALPDTAYQSAEYTDPAGIPGGSGTKVPGHRFPNKTKNVFGEVNEISTLIFATAPATVKIITSAATYTTDVAAGVTLFNPANSLPTGAGQGGYPQFQMIRDGVTVVDFPSAFPVRTGGDVAGTAAPYYQDHTHGMGGWLRYRMGQLGYQHPYIEPVELLRWWPKGVGLWGEPA